MAGAGSVGVAVGGTVGAAVGAAVGGVGIAASIALAAFARKAGARRRRPMNALPPVESKLRDARRTEVEDDTFSGQPERTRMMSTIAQSSGQVATTQPPRGRRGVLLATLAGVAAVSVVVTVITLAGSGGARGAKAPSAAPAELPAVDIGAPLSVPPGATERPSQPAATDFAAQVPTPPTMPGGADAPPGPVVDDSGKTTTKKRNRRPPPPSGGRSRDPDGLDIKVGRHCQPLPLRRPPDGTDGRRG